MEFQSSSEQTNEIYLIIPNKKDKSKRMKRKTCRRDIESNA